MPSCSVFILFTLCICCILCAVQQQQSIPSLLNDPNAGLEIVETKQQQREAFATVSEVIPKDVLSPPPPPQPPSSTSKASKNPISQVPPVKLLTKAALKQAHCLVKPRHPHNTAYHVGSSSGKAAYPCPTSCSSRHHHFYAHAVNQNESHKRFASGTGGPVDNTTTIQHLFFDPHTRQFYVHQQQLVPSAKKERQDNSSNNVQQDQSPENAPPRTHHAIQHNPQIDMEDLLRWLEEQLAKLKIDPGHAETLAQPLHHMPTLMHIIARERKKQEQGLAVTTADDSDPSTEEFFDEETRKALENTPGRIIVYKQLVNHLAMVEAATSMVDSSSNLNDSTTSTQDTMMDILSSAAIDDEGIPEGMDQIFFPSDNNPFGLISNNFSVLVQYYPKVLKKLIKVVSRHVNKKQTTIPHQPDTTPWLRIGDRVLLSWAPLSVFAQDDLDYLYGYLDPESDGLSTNVGMGAIGWLMLWSALTAVILWTIAVSWYFVWLLTWELRQDDVRWPWQLPSIDYLTDMAKFVAHRSQRRPSINNYLTTQASSLTGFIPTSPVIALTPPVQQPVIVSNKKKQQQQQHQKRKQKKTQAAIVVVQRKPSTDENQRPPSNNFIFSGQKNLEPIIAQKGANQNLLAASSITAASPGESESEIDSSFEFELSSLSEEEEEKSKSSYIITPGQPTEIPKVSPFHVQTQPKDGNFDKKVHESVKILTSAPQSISNKRHASAFTPAAVIRQDSCISPGMSFTSALAGVESIPYQSEQLASMLPPASSTPPPGLEKLAAILEGSSCASIASSGTYTPPHLRSLSMQQVKSKPQQPTVRIQQSQASSPLAPTTEVPPPPSPPAYLRRRSKLLPYLAYDESRREPVILPTTRNSFSSSTGLSSESTLPGFTNSFWQFTQALSTPSFSLFSHFNPTTKRGNEEEEEQIEGEPLESNTKSFDDPDLGHIVDQSPLISTLINSIEITETTTDTSTHVMTPRHPSPPSSPSFHLHSLIDSLLIGVDEGEDMSTATRKSPTPATASIVPTSTSVSLMPSQQCLL